MYKVFTRVWWKEAEQRGLWPDNLEPHCGRKTTISKNVKTQEEARSICEVYNKNHSPGRYSRKAEYEEQ